MIILRIKKSLKNIEKKSVKEEKNTFEAKKTNKPFLIKNETSSKHIEHARNFEIFLEKFRER